MTKQPQTGLIGRFYRQVENRPKKLKYVYIDSRFQHINCLYTGYIPIYSHFMAFCLPSCSLNFPFNVLCWP